MFLQIIILLNFFSSENIAKALRIANDEQLFGDQFSWFAGSKVSKNTFVRILIWNIFP